MFQYHIMVADFLEKVNEFWKLSMGDIILAGFIVLATLVGFGLGRLSILWLVQTPIQIVELENAARTPNMPLSGVSSPISDIQKPGGAITLAKNCFR